MKKNSELRTMARATLKGAWTQPVLATLMYVLIACIGAVTIGGKVSIILYVVSGLLTLGITMPMTYTYMQLFLEFARGEKEEMAGGLFDFFNRYFRAWTIEFLQVFYVALWSLLLIVPGVIKWMEISMANYIAKDTPDMRPSFCLKCSHDMMMGHKMDLFKLYLSFIGWFILGLIPMGIGLLWVMPYINTTLALFYDEVRIEYEKKTIELYGE